MSEHKSDGPDSLSEPKAKDMLARVWAVAQLLAEAASGEDDSKKSIEKTQA